MRGGASCASVGGHPQRCSCTAAAGRRSCCAAPAAPAAPAAARPSGCGASNSAAATPPGWVKRGEISDSGGGALGCSAGPMRPRSSSVAQRACRACARASAPRAVGGQVCRRQGGAFGHAAPTGSACRCPSKPWLEMPMSSLAARAARPVARLVSRVSKHQMRRRAALTPTALTKQAPAWW